MKTMVLNNILTVANIIHIKKILADDVCCELCNQSSRNKLDFIKKQHIQLPGTF